VRIKALPLSQSKEEKRTKGVITIQRDKDSWNQRPQTLGSLTPPLTHASHTRARLHAHYHRPTPPLQLTTATHAPFCSAPTAIVADNMPPSPCRACCLVSPAPSPPLCNRAPPLAYKPPSSLSSHPKQNTPDKTPSAKSQATPFSTPSPLRSQCLVILGERELGLHLFPN
jgi:hypothetical protein